MLDHAAMDAEFSEVEEMVRAAGDFLEVTEDLRPQTLERARDESRRASTRFWIAVVAAVVVILATSAGLLRSRLSSTPPLLAGVCADSDQLYETARHKAAQANADPHWSLVDAFSELRRRQASLFRDAF
jgi:hypothetical protein